MIDFAEHNSQSTQNSLRLQQFVDFYNALSASNLADLSRLYHQDVVFVDPVHQIKGLQGLQSYFEHAYERLNSCHFTPVQQAGTAEQGFISWRMRLSHPAINKGELFDVEGCSELRWHQDGRIIYHRDYYDLTDMVYRHIPLLGWLTAKVKQKMAQD
ncbi:nuclear transport factor 2 family protein [Rheinheimera sp.]|uniref:nuclear transport factor 2 family protein n=1 Tax=Rheinheimera sp. TaxID=1869214 RepID=UPI0025CCC291|nr:nuclear transport factor 2 family protein [Rheinheimera sp.]